MALLYKGFLKRSLKKFGFAIPINSVRHIILSILEKGCYAKPYVGISITDISIQTQLYGVPAGAAIQSVTENSPAQKAGLQAGDVITTVNGTPMTSEEIADFIGLYQVGQAITFSVYRQGEELEITVTVGECIQEISGSTGKTPTGRFPSPSGG